MVSGRQVLDLLDVRRPVDVIRILRTGDAEVEMRQTTGRPDQQLLEGGLPVVAVGAEVGEVPVFPDVEWRVCLGIDRAVQCSCPRRSELALDAIQRGPTRERQIEVIAGDELWRDIFEVAALELCEGDRRVDVVEGGYPACRL